jgi:radical SAM superfamily enzyme YgiQ (UPF0313 family)
LLVNPPARRFVYFQGANFPLGLGYIAAVLEKEGYAVEIYDAEWNVDLFSTPWPKYRWYDMAENWYKYFDALQNSEHEVWHEVESVFRERNPQVIGITSRSLDLPSAQVLARIAKEINKGMVVVLGGPAATTCPERVLQDQNIDFVVRGEGEITMTELLKTLQSPKPDFHSIDGLSFRESGRIVHNKRRALIKDIDTLPYPAKPLLLYTDKLPRWAYNVINGDIVTSRGCPYACTFCANHSVWGSRKARLRKAEYVVEEILYQKDTYDIREFVFWDDLFTVSRSRTVEICNLLLEKKANVNWLCLVRADTIDDELLSLMKQAGCVEVQIGVESGSNRILKKMQKGITVEQTKKAAEMMNRSGLRWHAFLLIGIPGETKEEMEATMNIIPELKPSYVQLSAFAPYPGTVLYEELKEKGLLTENEVSHADYHNLDYCYIGTMPCEEFRKLALGYFKQVDEYNNDMIRRNSSLAVMQLVSVDTSLTGMVGIEPQQLQTAPWGIETYDDGSLLWLGHGETEGIAGVLWAVEKRVVQVVFTVEPGPAREDSLRTVELTLDTEAGTKTERQQFDRSTSLTFEVELQAGRNEFSFQVLDEPTILEQPNGDTRPLLVLLRRVTVEPAASPCLTGKTIAPSTPIYNNGDRSKLFSRQKTAREWLNTFNQFLIKRVVSKLIEGPD